VLGVGWWAVASADRSHFVGRILLGEPVDLRARAFLCETVPVY
jgi:hypothetical protein